MTRKKTMESFLRQLSAEGIICQLSAEGIRCRASEVVFTWSAEMVNVNREDLETKTVFLSAHTLTDNGH